MYPRLLPFSSSPDAGCLVSLTFLKTVLFVNRLVLLTFSNFFMPHYKAFQVCAFFISQCPRVIVVKHCAPHNQWHTVFENRNSSFQNVEYTAGNILRGTIKTHTLCRKQEITSSNFCAVLVNDVSAHWLWLHVFLITVYLRSDRITQRIISLRLT